MYTYIYVYIHIDYLPLYPQMANFHRTLISECHGSPRFFFGGDVANQTCHALETTKARKPWLVTLAKWREVPRIWYGRRMIAMVYYRKPWICFIFKEFEDAGHFATRKKGDGTNMILQTKMVLET